MPRCSWSPRYLIPSYWALAPFFSVSNTIHPVIICTVSFGDPSTSILSAFMFCCSLGCVIPAYHISYVFTVDSDLPCLLRQTDLSRYCAMYPSLHAGWSGQCHRAAHIHSTTEAYNNSPLNVLYGSTAQESDHEPPALFIIQVKIPTRRSNHPVTLVPPSCGHA